MAITYEDAGVSVEAGYEAVRLMKQHVAGTLNENVLGGLGSFGGFYSLAKETMKEPVLVAGTDGVGTKLKYAFIMDKHDTIGIDAVAMCVNDIVCQGARPLFFLDYMASSKTQPQKVADIVKGIAEGCKQSGAAIIGGETAEMPGFYNGDEYDIAGFAVGIVDKEKAISGARVQVGDVLIGLPSSGIHSNGYSLVRKLVGEDRAKLDEYNEELGCTWGEEVLRPTKIYVKEILALIEKADIHGIAHITGGGFIENIPRILPPSTHADITLGSWPVLPVFNLLQKLGDIPERSIYNTFNMGIGMVLAVPSSHADEILTIAKDELGIEAYRIGVVAPGQEGVELCR
ncbi:MULTISPECIES: phosphoribosylformylglycinamidine cyclo-ligase [unclassified Clostridium]|uniref:phosphoribosylformylglycinamidine cyclo-ligase n=1 Tax=unclassified Clostridium TaxID=2614128 RepID=UPI0011061288|nr:MULTISPECIES: phosphoribosylformylglycinamidine cyclo-ligase [unclassified Clostridium]